MRAALWAAVLAIACDDDATTGDKPGDDDDDTPADTDTTDTATVPDTDTTQRDGCYADWEGDISDDGSIDGTGLDVYDPVRTDLLLDVTRMYSFFDKYAYHYSYDANGHLTRFEYDDGDDGFPEYVYTETWDGDLVVEYTADEDGDGVPEEIWTYTYTAQGWIDTVSEDTDNDGDPDYGYSYAYDENGRRLFAYQDLDGDEVTDVWYTYVYDAVGRVTVFSGDTGNNGTVDYLLTYTYTDPVLYVGSSVTDEDNDGTPEATETFAYDADFNLLFLEEDDGADGNVNHRAQISYTTSGLEAVVDEEYYDDPEDGDGETVLHDEYTYDASDRLIEDFSDGYFLYGGQQIALLSRQTWTFGGTCP
jgi:serralysin